MIKEGVLKKGSTISNERKIFLFSDMIIYCISTKKPPFAFKGKIEINSSTWIHDDDSSFILF